MCSRDPAAPRRHGRPLGLGIVVEGDKRLVQPIRRDAGKSGQASKCQKGSRPAIHRLARLGGRPERQNAITGYQINGQQLFYPNANDLKDLKAVFTLPDTALSNLTASCTKVLLGS
jgi:hypothetical protein